MKKILRVFFLVFTFLFINLLSINVSSIKADDSGVTLDLTNAYRGEIRNYWALVNYGNSFVGENTISIFLDPEAIANQDVKYILISEYDENGDIISTYYERGVDSSFGSSFLYSFVNEDYGNKTFTIFLLSDLYQLPFGIIDRIDVDNIEKLRTIDGLSRADFDIYSDEYDIYARGADVVWTSTPYKVYVDILNNSCDYKVKTVSYSYNHLNPDGSERLITGNAIKDETGCNKFYFMVNENAVYDIKVEDYFGYVKPIEGENWQIEIVNFLDTTIQLVVDYDNRLTNSSVYLDVSVYDGRGVAYPSSLIELLTVTDEAGNVVDIKNIYTYEATENGVYVVTCKTSVAEVYVEVNITNIDKVNPIVYMVDEIYINSSDVESSPYIFDPNTYILSTDDVTPGDKIRKVTTYYYVSEADPTCKVTMGNRLDYELFDYLYSVNDVCMEVEVFDEAGNNAFAKAKILVSDNTKPTINALTKEIELEIGDRMPSDEELVEMFRVVVNDNSIKYNPERVIVTVGDLSNVNLEELGVYEVYIHCIDEAGNQSEILPLTVVVTRRILVIDAVPNQYIVYGEEMIEILYTCNGNPCKNLDNPEDSEILVSDWNKLTGALYIPTGSIYSGEYNIYSTLTINSNKYYIDLNDLGVFTIKPRLFKIVANSYSIDYKDAEPVLTWYMDTSVCNPDLSTKYTSFFEPNYSCTFVGGDNFGGGSYVHNVMNGKTIYAGAIKREEGNLVKYNAGNVTYYKINIGDLTVREISSGGRTNYSIDFYGMDGILTVVEPEDWEDKYYNYYYLDDGEYVALTSPTIWEADKYYYKDTVTGNGIEYLTSAYAKFYIYPKYVEITLGNVTKIYGEDDPNTNYLDIYKDVLKEDGKGHVQYNFVCFSYKEPIKSMCLEGSGSYSLSSVQSEIGMTINREDGENVGRYKITATYTNDNYEVFFNEDTHPEYDREPKPAAYLTIVKRNIELSVTGEDGDGKYTIYYEDALPVVTVTLDTDPNILYEGYANNTYLNINNGNIVSFADRLDYGSHRVAYYDGATRMEVVIGGFEEYITGVGTFTIKKDTLTIVNLHGEDVWSNYNVTFNEGELKVLARQIYIKIIEGLNKIYGDADPTYTKTYVDNKYGVPNNLVVDGSGNYVLQIINTLDNTTIVDRDDYEPFDKDLLVYHLLRSKDSPGVDSLDIHEGEMVGNYLINEDYFENSTNYIIDIYEEYKFRINPREIVVNINDASIEFNYDNLVPKFSYGFSNLVFTDVLIGQPIVASSAGYRNNGHYDITIGNITPISSNPFISDDGEYWYINGESTGVMLSDLASLDRSLLKISSGKYTIYNVNTNTYITTEVDFKEYSVSDNYIVSYTAGTLDVVPREVIIVPDSGKTKIYAEYDPAFTYKVIHYSRYINNDYTLEAIRDPSDFTGTLSRVAGEKPGTYHITEGDLAPAEKGVVHGRNFIIKGFDSSITFDIFKRDLVIRHAASDASNRVQVFYGDSSLDSIVSGFSIVSGREGVNVDLCTMEMIEGVSTCDMIYDKIAGGIATDPANAEDVGTYRIINLDLRLERVISGINVTDYYNLTFIEATLVILPRVIYITPNEGQSKIYGEGGGANCDITYSYAPHLIKHTDTFSGCLKREPKLNADGVLTSEEVGEYTITMGDLVIGPNYRLVMNGSVRYQILVRNITITAKVTGDDVTKNGSLNVYTVMYGNEYELSYDVGGMGLVDNSDLGIRDTMINNVKLSPDYNGVGTYLVLQGPLAIANNKSRNYNVTFEKATLVVIKRVVNVKPMALTKVYGEPDPSSYPFELTGEVAPYTGELSRVPGNNAGRYKIVQGTLDFGPNYEVAIEETYFEILKREVTVTAHDQEKLYLHDDPVLSYTMEVQDDFEIDTPILGKLERDSGEDVGVYDINIGTLNLNSNYNITYIGATFTIRYATFEYIVINNITQNQYQTQGEESLVKLEARFNKGADETHLKDVTWTVVKDGQNVDFDIDLNNVISFMPSGTAGIYVVTASYNGVSATHEINVRPNNVSNIHITLTNGEDTQKLGAESELVYRADIQLYDDLYNNINIEWFVGNTRVCDIVVSSSTSYCRFTPNRDIELSVGTYTVYASIGSITSANSLQLTIKDNAAPTITLEKQAEVYYIEAFQNATENSIAYNEPGFKAMDDIDGDITINVRIEGDRDINYYKTGTYVIIYTVTDSHGHVASNYRTVIVRDTIAPTVELINPELSEIILEFGDEYVEYGATAVDAYDAYYGYELRTYIDNQIDINKIGVYLVRYSFIDSNGNEAEAYRRVIIQDTIKPTITLIGESTIYLEYLEIFSDEGAWFEDNYDGRSRLYATTIVYVDPDTLETTEVSSVDTSLLGTYRLTYYREDTSGNTPESVPTRTVIVRDSTPPVITLLGSNPFILRYGDTYVDPGYTVIDNYDGDITDNEDLVDVEAIIGDTLGTYYVYYRAKDTHNNIADEVRRTVIVLDLVSPIIYFTNDCPQYIYLEALVEEYDQRCNLPGMGYTVYDDYTPDIDAIQNWVSIRGSVDVTTIGTYPITYNVSDRSGNAAVTLTRYVVVQDTLKPTITLKPNPDGDIDFYVEVFGEYVEYGWEAHDIYDDFHFNEITVEVSEEIDLRKLNTYEVKYVAIDTNGNRSDPVYRYVTVRDTIPPVVTINGDAEVVVERGTNYVDLGARAQDNYDGLITDVYITTMVPTGMLRGHYEVIYCAKDTSGNEGCAKRDVYVEDTIAPVVYGASDGAYYRNPFYIYFAPSFAGTDEVLTGWLNGKLITSPWQIKDEGIYNLLVADDAGNETRLTFTLDRTPPTLYGTNDKQYINHDVKIYSDELLESISYKLNNGGFVTENIQEIEFTVEGQYSVYATDMAGNVAKTITFIIDKTPPEYALVGVENKGITAGDVSLVTENDVVVSVNGEYISTNHRFVDNGYYKVTIRDKAGNDVFLQFVINKKSNVTISGENVTFMSQNNAINKFIAPADTAYPRGTGFIFAKPKLDGTFEYISGTLFSDDEYSKLISGESLSYDVPGVGDENMVVAFIVTLDQLNKFTTQTVEGDDDSALIYTFAAIGIAALGGATFYFFVIAKRKKEEQEEEVDEEEIIDDDYY